MYEPFNKLKFYGAASYVDQIRAGIQYFVTKKGKKALCAMYQDTDFGKEVLDGVQMQAEKLKIKVVETVTHKPTDQDFTAPITKLKQAGCDLILMVTHGRGAFGEFLYGSQTKAVLAGSKLPLLVLH